MIKLQHIVKKGDAKLNPPLPPRPLFITYEFHGSRRRWRSAAVNLQQQNIYRKERNPFRFNLY